MIPYQKPLALDIARWAGICLQDITYSGSYAKGTALDSSSDLDLFVSLKSSTEDSLFEIYKTLANSLKAAGYNTREQNVSVRVSKFGYDIDVVPAKNNKGNTNMHKLYNKRKDSWIQTDVKKHINIVSKSNRIEEISALKIWRNINGLKLPSIMLEIMTVKALKGKKIGDIENNIFYMLNFIKNNIEAITVVDPANTNNIISDNMYKYEKEAVKKAAGSAMTKQYWSEIIW